MAGAEPDTKALLLVPAALAVLPVAAVAVAEAAVAPLRALPTACVVPSVASTFAGLSLVGAAAEAGAGYGTSGVRYGAACGCACAGYCKSAPEALALGGGEW